MKKARQRKTNTAWYHLYVESKKIQQTSEYHKKMKQTHRYRELVVTSGEMEVGRGSVGVGD